MTTRSFALLGLFVFAPSAGCATAFAAQGGRSVLATPRGHTIIAGEAHGSVHAGVGLNPVAALAGLELNGRVSNDYGHGSLGAGERTSNGGSSSTRHPVAPRSVIASSSPSLVGYRAAPCVRRSFRGRN